MRAVTRGRRPFAQGSRLLGGCDLAARRVRARHSRDRGRRLDLSIWGGMAWEFTEITEPASGKPALIDPCIGG